MIAFFFKMFAIGIGFSVIRFLFRQNFITELQMTKIVSAYFLAQVFQFLFSGNFLWQWTFVFAPIFAFIAWIFFYRARLESRFSSEFPDMLTNMILHMRAGKSFRRSLQETAADVPERYATRLLYILENVVFSPQNGDKRMTQRSPFIRQIIVEFAKIDRSSHQSIEKIENFRCRLLILRDFRRRSGQIRGQIQSQALVLTLIYGLCLAFVAISFPLRELAGLILFSALLFLAGLLVMIQLGRRVKWKI